MTAWGLEADIKNPPKAGRLMYGDVNAVAVPLNAAALCKG
jgi:hypothetical protein